MLVYIQQKDMQQSRTKINKFLSITTKINKTQSQKLKKTQNPNMQYEPFRIFNLLPPFYNPQMPFP